MIGAGCCKSSNQCVGDMHRRERVQDHLIAALAIVTPNVVHFDLVAPPCQLDHSGRLALFQSLPRRSTVKRAAR